MFLNTTYLLRTSKIILNVKQKELLNHLKYFTSEKLEGRGSTTAGERLAGQYIAEHFKKHGLKPYGEDETYFQSFDVIVGSKFKEGSLLQLDYKKIESSFVIEKDYVPFSFSAEHKVEGQLVFAGYGITNEGSDYDDYANLDVKGKVVLLLRREPTKDGGPASGGSSKFGGKGWSEHASFIQKVRNAESRR